MRQGMESSWQTSRNQALTAGLFTLLFAGFMTVASRAAFGADTNIYLHLVATCYFAPAAVAMTVASVARLNEWKYCDLVQQLAMAVAIGPALYVAMGALLGLML